MKIRVTVLMLFIGVISMFGQSENIAELSFNNLLNGSNAIGLNTATLNIQYPQKLQKGTLMHGISFSNFELDYNGQENINTNEISNFKTFSYSLGYENSLNNNWSYNIQFSPSISSNLEANISSKDVLFNGAISFNKTINKSNLSFGLVLNSNYGLTIPIPIISYSKEVNEKFQYTIGIPRTTMQYKFNSNNNIKFYAQPKGFVANLSNNLVFENSIAKKAKYQSIITGIKYNHRIDDYWQLFLDTGYQLSSNFNLENGNTNVYEFNTKDQFYAGVGLKFNL